MIDDDDRLPLEALRTPVPLRDADYAAIRARVLSGFAERKRRKHGWWWAFATAAMLVLWRSAGVPPASVVEPRRGALAPVISTSNERPPAAIAVATKGAGEPPALIARTATVRRPKRPPLHRAARPTTEAPKTEEMRIHIQTADPDVRIIWIVNATPSTTDKEKS